MIWLHSTAAAFGAFRRACTSWRAWASICTDNPLAPDWLPESSSSQRVRCLELTCSSDRIRDVPVHMPTLEAVVLLQCNNNLYLTSWSRPRSTCVASALHVPNGA